MTLAAILLFSVFSTVPTRALGTAEVYPSAQTSSAPSTSNAQNTTGTATPQTSATPASSAVQPKPTATARPHHKKKVISGCPATPASATSASPGSSPSDPAAGSTPGHTSTATSAKTNCPPPKIVVRQGGTSEPPIQLGGGETGGQASAEKATANQMLGTAEENLKKLGGRDLSSTEQETVTQIRQYMDQSKAAVTAGDPERARNLAWKAQTLSEDLLKTLQ